jgi:hypothetical protein
MDLLELQAQPDTSLAGGLIPLPTSFVAQASTAWLLSLSDRGRTFESQLRLPRYLQYFSGPELEWMRPIEAFQVVWASAIALLGGLVLMFAGTPTYPLGAWEVLGFAVGLFGVAWLAVLGVSAIAVLQQFAANLVRSMPPLG